MDQNQVKVFLEQKSYWDLLDPQKRFEAIAQILLQEALIQNWPEYENLEVIVMGSSPIEGFMSFGVFVDEPEPGRYLPNAVKKFRDALDSAFPQRIKRNYDYHAL